MVIKRTGHKRFTAQSPGTRGPLTTLFSILGDVSQATGIGIRYF